MSPLVGGMGELSHTASLLFNTSTLPQRIVSYLDGSRLHRDDVVIGVAGFINYVALLKNALNFSKFHKQDADFIWLAQIELQRGHPAVALRHLNQLSRDARNRTASNTQLSQVICNIKKSVSLKQPEWQHHSAFEAPTILR